MRKWNIEFDRSLILTISADSRFTKTNYTDDQIWEVKFGEGNSPSLAIQSTLGLRAQQLRLIPRFIENDLLLSDPKDYFSQPCIVNFLTNYISIAMMPFTDIDAFIEIFVPDSSTIIGRTKITNLSDQIRNFSIEWLCQLNSNDGHPMAPLTLQAAPVLSGKTGNLHPVFFMTGGPKPGQGSYPSLSISTTLSPKHSEMLTWILSSQDTTEKSFDKCRSIASTNLDAKISSIKLENSGLIEIYTGNREWDLAFELSQQAALGLILSPTEHMENASYVLNRHPDQGFSLGGDGKDYNHLWSGQSPVESYYLIQFLLPMYPELAKGLLFNFLDKQLADGFIDWKPGLGGQSSKIIATPILTSIAWKIYENNQDNEFLKDIYPKLVKFIEKWLSLDFDTDEDGIPEWSNILQTGFEDHPVYSPWQITSLGARINTSESPDLCAFLYRECSLLQKIANILGYMDASKYFSERAETFFYHTGAFWNSTLHIFNDRDKDTHYSFPSYVITNFFGSGIISINKKFKTPTRLLFHLYTQNDQTPAPDIYIHGISSSGKKRVEHLKPEDIKWYPERGILTGEQVYKSIEFLEIKNFDSSDQIILHSIGYQALTQNTFTPLWAQAVDKTTADDLINSTIMNPSTFWSDYGIPSTSISDINMNNNMVHVNINAMILEGLIYYGFRDLAAELMNNIMKGLIKSLKDDFSLRMYYNPSSGRGFGERYALPGLAPINQFLQIIGVKIISPEQIILEGYNPFSWPVTIKYRGLNVLRQQARTTVVFPNGHSINTDEQKKQVISLQ